MQLLTHSSTQTYKTCPRKYQLSYLLGVRRDIDGEPLRMGAAFHEGIDVLKGGGDINAACQRVYANYELLPAWCQTPEQCDDWATECETVVRLLTAWAWRWQADGLTYVATEQAWQMPLVNPDTGAASKTFVLAGKIDGIAKLPDGRLAVVEHKTTGDSIDADSDYWKRLRIDHQITLYMLAARHLGHDVQTVLYDVARKPSIRPKLVGKGEDKHRETSDEYGERLTADIAERPDFYFARQEIPRLDSDLTEFRQEVWQLGKQLIDAENGGRYFRNSGACVSPYPCQYLNICANGIDVSNHLPTGFIKVSDVHPELGLATSVDKANEKNDNAVAV